MKKKLVLIDGHSILNRAYYGLPNLTNSAGIHTGAVFGFLNIMFKILEEEKPDYIAVAFDVHAPTFRHEMYEAYKGTRKPMPEELREQVPLMKDMLRAMNVQMASQAGLEADDILGTLAKKAEAEGMEVSLISGDRDLLQIATDHIKIRIPKTKQGRTEIEDYYASDVLEKLQVTPTQFIELKALMGDTADNIPGVPKIGEKTATELMLQFGSIDGIYSHLDEITKKSVKETLAANRDLADLSKTLATIKTDCDIQLDYEHAKAEGFYSQEAYELCKKLEFRNLLSRFQLSVTEKKTRQHGTFRKLKNLSELKRVLNSFQERESILDPKDAAGQGTIAVCELGFQPLLDQGRILAVAFSLPDGNAYFYVPKQKEDKSLPVGQLSFLDMLGQGQADEEGIGATNSEVSAASTEDNSEQALRKYLLELSEKTGLATFDIKRQYAFLSIKDESIARYFDILIAAYLLNPLKSDYEADTIASEHLDQLIPGKVETFGKLSARETLEKEPAKVMEYLCSMAEIARKAAKVLGEKLIRSGMDRLMREIEMPLSIVLYDMEREGVMVKREALKAYGDALTGRIMELENSIHEKAGRAFNIQSPKQLAEVLFEEMKLPGGKKTKTGYSTAADVLEKLAPEHAIVREILEYRGLTKLKSTYVEGLSTYIGTDERIHTNFNQTITATGRISSTEPNLQNIPMRTELGRGIRKVFVPAPGHIFLDADYSQIELRILAHMSGDSQLIEAYRMDQDIHRITASKVFHVPFEEVTDLQRRNAKAVNFGIVYGISSFGLSQDLSITPKEAAVYIQQYFQTYPGIKKFLDQSVEDAKEKGYGITLYGRRRPIPELASSNFMTRSFGERIAMNSPIQGTAADIMKIAMIRVWKALRDAGLKSKVILQVHDELVIEALEEEAQEARRILEENMKDAAQLAVALIVDVHEGKDWYSAK